jgi:Zn-finger nucleic acid-binding protein
MLTTTLSPVCPDHKIPLITKADGPRRFRCCPQCLGFWFARSDLNYLHVTEENLKEQKLVELGFGVKSLRPCPQCRKTSMLVKKVRGVEVDICTACLGIWLDAGELYRLSEVKFKTSSRSKIEQNDRNSGVGDVLDALDAGGNFIELGGHALEFLGEVLGGLDIGI